MASEPKDGGPAFPTPAHTEPGKWVATVDLGISARDYFAAKALNGMISSEANGIDRTKVNKGRWARVAYEFADAMLAERAKERP